MVNIASDFTIKTHKVSEIEMTEIKKLEQQIELLNKRLDGQIEIIQYLQETIALHMQTIIFMKNDMQNLNSYTAFLMNQLTLVANGQPVPELHAAMQSFIAFKKDKTH